MTTSKRSDAVLAWLRGTARTAWALPLSERLGLFLIGICLVAGGYFRARGFLWDRSGLWLDESTWAMMLVRLPIEDLLIRPPGFVVVSRLSVWLFGASETALRALPWLAGMASLALGPALAFRLFSAPGARALFVAIVALHPLAIDFSKEFKPYSLSLTLHLLLLLLTLRYVADRRTRDLRWLLGAATVSVLCAQDMVFAYPGVFLVAGITAWRYERRQLVPIAIAALVIVGLLAAQYYFIWSRLPAQESDHWGKKYNVFHMGEQSYLEWLWTRYRETLALPGYRRRFWLEWSDNQLRIVQHIDRAIWIVLFVLSLLTMAVRRRWVEALLLLPPLLLMGVFNLAGYWPLGVFRTNVFLCAYTAALASLALDGRHGQRSLIGAVLPATLLVLIPLFVFDGSLYSGKRALSYETQFPKVVEWLARKETENPALGRQLLLIDRRSCDLWTYYTEFHPTVSKLFPRIEQKFRPRYVRNDSSLVPQLKRAARAGEPTAWVIVHARRDFEAQLRSRRLGPLVRGEQVGIGRHTIYSFPSKKAR